MSETIVRERQVKTVGVTPDGWAIKEYAGPELRVKEFEVLPHCYYCENGERKECPTCVDRSEFKATEDSRRLVL